jgi:hypothetical protein
MEKKEKKKEEKKKKKKKKWCMSEKTESKEVQTSWYLSLYVTFWNK